VSAWWERSAATTPLTSGGRESGTVAAPKKTGRSSTRPAARAEAAAGAEAGGARAAAATAASQVGADLTVTGWDYAPAPEARDVVRIKDEYGLFIGGEFVPAADGRQLTTINPATEEPLARVAEAGPADVDAAVAAARAAYERTWRDMPGAERAKYLFRIARIIQERSREFAVLESLDNGKPIRESRDVDVPLAAAHFFYYAGWADKLDYAGLGPAPQPLGVAGQVIPWNFPLLMAAWKLAPALAAGNTCVLKPAETTPLTALLLAEVCQQAGLPPGVVNVLTGDGTAGAALVAHPDVSKVAFTGSTEVGKQIARAVAGTTKKLTLELGGKAANIVFDDAPMDQAIEGIVNGIFFNQGHVCCAGSRLLVQESVADAVLERLQRRLGTLRLGDPLDKNTDIGAINSREQLAKIRDLTDAGEQEGAERWSPPCQLPERGFWFAPTIFTGVSQSHRIAREEIFGPVLSVLTFRTPEEAVAKANNTPYGLSAGLWTDKGSRILWLAQRLRAGVIWANTFNKFDPASPFGGYRESGFGREGGRPGLAAYLDV
jgi:aldehyde dehydrogenase (NAD+)